MSQHMTDLRTQVSDAVEAATKSIREANNLSERTAVERANAAANASWALAGAQITATLMVVEAIEGLTAALRHLEGGLTS